MKILSLDLELNKFILLALVFLSCSYFSIAQEAQQPSIMIIPSDNQLKRLGCLDEKENLGRTVYIRQYERAFVSDASLKFVISAIQSKFADRGFPLEDMEQTLKQVQDEEALNIADNIEVDMRSMLLNSARPDIILELTYELKKGGMGNVLTFNLAAKDAYTFEVIGAATNPGIETIETNVEKMMAEQVENNTQNLQSQMQDHFNDLKANGRKITLRIALEAGSSDDLTGFCDALDEEYAYVIQDWVKKNTVNHSYKRGKSSDTEVRFSNVRIPLFDEEGYPMAATDWVRKLRKYLRKTCSANSKDKTIGLGGAVLMLQL